MAMFTLYCDDSGTHAQSPIAVAACFIAPVLQWEHFVKDWNDANDAENFDVFHMADFVAHKEQFALPEWQDEQKRARTLQRLISIINIRRHYAIAAAVEKIALDKEMPQHFTEGYALGKNHYTFAMRMCLGKVLKWRKRHGHTEPIQYIFDEMSKGKGEINAVFERVLSEGAEQMQAFGVAKGGWSFQSKSAVLPLQAADILAWESYNYMQKTYLPEIKQPMRKSFEVLTEKAFENAYHRRDTVKALVKDLEAKHELRKKQIKRPD
jgi:hypothetical protein